MNKFYLLGANDAEMIRIEDILKERSLPYQYAMVDGKRCHPENAYKADPIVSSFAVPSEDLVLVECRPANGDYSESVRIDHHNPGDPGYGMSPEHFWQASSIGQLYSYLKIDEIPQEDRVLAAMDHSPASAILGLCPEVTAEEVIDRKIEELHKWLKVPNELIKARMLESDTLIKSMPFEVIGGQEIRDLRALSYGASSDLNLRCAVLAALAGGYAILYRQEYNDKKEIGVQGHATPETIEAFMQEWGPANELTGIYGAPNRGFAGGYLQ